MTSMRDRRNAARDRFRNGGTTYTDRDRGVSLGDVLSRVLYWVVIVATLPVRLLQWLTEPPGSAVLFGFAVAYFIGLSCEGYWQAAQPTAPSFILKPFLSDGANPIYVFAALVSPSFWVMSALSTVIQAIQAAVLRDISLEHAKQQYEQVAGFEVPEGNPKGVDLAEFKRRQLKRAGTKSLKVRGFVCVLAYGVDIAIAFANFPLIGLDGFGSLLRNVVWILLSVFGAEAAIALFMDALDKGKAAMATKKAQPEAEA